MRTPPPSTPLKTTAADISAAALRSFENTPDLRAKTLLQVAVKHLHAFALETNLTTNELIRLAEILTAAGKISDASRHEFLLMSDAMGLTIAPDEVGDVYVHVDEEADGGLIVSGAKVVATGSALTHYTFVAHHGAVPLQTKKFAIVFAIPSNAPGLKFICRGSYEFAANVVGSPFDYPLSSRLDENDAILVLDRAFVP